MARSSLTKFGIRRGPDLDELCQVVFAVAARHDIEPTKPWLHETARKQAANFRKLFRHKFEGLDPDAGEDVAVELEEPELRIDVRRALAKLRPEEAEVLGDGRVEERGAQASTAGAQAVRRGARRREGVYERVVRD
jgi:DNA-directed RNA polymerase specialized sigma24 family protein